MRNEAEDPQLGVDYHVAITKHTLADLDAEHARIKRDEWPAGKAYVFQRMNTASPPIDYDRTKWYVGWQIKISDEKIVWLRIPLFDLMDESRKLIDKQNEQEQM